MDIKIFFLINHSGANALLDVLMPFLSRNGYLLVLPFLAYMLFKASKVQDPSGKTFIGAAVLTIAISVCSVLLGGVLEAVLKTSIARIRPCHVLEGVRLLTICPEGYSMPSGHAISSFAFSVPLFFLSKKYLSTPVRVYPLFIASLIAISRVYVGVHYPSDILAGIIVGSSEAMALCLLVEFMRSKAEGPDQ